jgi:hypothetical protein
MRELVRYIQNARKEAKLEFSDRIRLGIESSDRQITGVLKKYETTIKQETLALSLGEVVQPSYEATVKVNTKPVIIQISKA